MRNIYQGITYMATKTTVYPYIPNSIPGVKAAMLEACKVKSVEEFFEDIPADLRLNRPLNLPAPLLSEARLKRHVEGIMARNTAADEVISFLGGGCYQQHIPAVCDEINGRSEFLSAYAGEPYDDHGRFQSLFEYCSMMGEMLNFDVVTVPTFDGFQAAATACRMSGRYTGRKTVLVAGNVNPDAYSHITNYGRSDLNFVTVRYNAESGLIDQNDLREKLSAEVAGLYFENPSYLGTLEDGQAISDIVKPHGAMLLVGVDPSSLGVLTPPADYGADIACGDIQTLGMHMGYGSGHGGFLSSRDEEALVMQYPSRLFGITPTQVPGEYGFGDVAYSRTSFDQRENGNEYVGTAAALWGITAGVYLATMGPQGMQELGDGLMKRVAYLKKQLATLPGVKISHARSVHFRECVVNFDATGRTVAELSAALREHGIFAGHDLSSIFPELGQAALFCVSELHAQRDIDHLIATLSKLLITN
jgi:glycine dehydrogenase subunit 1